MAIDRNYPNEFVAADVETTGLEAINGDRIVEIGLVRFDGGLMVDKFVSLLDPCRPIPPYVTRRFHGITDAMVAGAPLFPAILSASREFVGNLPVVCHNAPFDLSFLDREAGGYWVDSDVYCTLRLAERSKIFTGSLRLPDLAKEVGIEGRFHRAEADAYAAGKLMCFLLERGVKLDAYRRHVSRPHCSNETTRRLAQTTP